MFIIARFVISDLGELRAAKGGATFREQICPITNVPERLFVTKKFFCVFPAVPKKF